MRLLLLSFLGLVLLFCTGLVCYRSADDFLAREADRREAEYYRGVYSVCSAQTHDQLFCKMIIGRMVALGVYQLPDDGWTWPLPNPDASQN